MYFIINVYGNFDIFDPIKVINVIFIINIHRLILLIRINLLLINLVWLIKGMKNQIKIEINIIIKPVSLSLIDRKIE